MSDNAGDLIADDLAQTTLSHPPAIGREVRRRRHRGLDGRDDRARVATEYSTGIRPCHRAPRYVCSTFGMVHIMGRGTTPIHLL